MNSLKVTGTTLEDVTNSYLTLLSMASIFPKNTKTYKNTEARYQQKDTNYSFSSFKDLRHTVALFTSSR